MGNNGVGHFARHKLSTNMTLRGLNWIICVILLSQSVYKADAVCPEKCRCPGPSQIDCSNSGLRSIPEDLDSGVRLLDLSRNRITEIPQDIFIRLQVTNISVLLLDNNEIRTISPYAFRGLSNLEILSVRRNKLNRLEENALSGIKGRGEVCQYKEMCYIDFTENEIGLIQPNALAWIKGMSIYLGKSSVNLKIKAYAFYGIMDVPAIEIMDVPKIDIEPRAFTNAENVGVLEIYDAMIPWIKAYTFEGLTNVVAINISDCDLGLIEKYAFSGIQYSPEFDSNHTFGGSGGHFTIQACSIQALPTHAFLDTNLALITIKKNTITSLSKQTFQGLPGLQSLHIIGNSLGTLQSYSLGYLKNMKEIIIQRNDLSVIQSNAFYGTQDVQYISIGLSPKANLTLQQQAFNQMFDIDYFTIEGINSLYVQPGAFENMFGIDVLEIKNVYLPILQTSVFQGLSKVKTLRLINCGLSSVQPSAFGVDVSTGTIDLLDLTVGNRIPCDCETSRMLEEFESTFSSYRVSCLDQESVLEGRLVADLYITTCGTDNLACSLCAFIIIAFLHLIL